MFLLFCFVSCFPLVIVCKFFLFIGVSLVHPVVLSLSLSVVLVPAPFPESSLVADSPDLTDFWDFKCYHPRAKLGALWAATLSPFASESPTSLFSGRVSCPIVWTVCPPRPFVYPLFLIIFPLFILHLGPPLTSPDINCVINSLYVYISRT